MGNAASVEVPPRTAYKLSKPRLGNHASFLAPSAGLQSANGYDSSSLSSTVNLSAAQQLNYAVHRADTTRFSASASALPAASSWTEGGVAIPPRAGARDESDDDTPPPPPAKDDKHSTRRTSFFRSKGSQNNVRSRNPRRNSAGLPPPPHRPEGPTRATSMIYVPGSARSYDMSMIER